MPTLLLIVGTLTSAFAQPSTKLRNIEPAPGPGYTIYTDANGKQYYVTSANGAVTVNNTPIAYVPAASSNPSNNNEVVTDPNGDIWIIDSDGDAVKISAVITGAETQVNAGTGITVTGSGTSASPYVINTTITQADGSETAVSAGSNVTVTGSGTSGDPYIISSTGGGAGDGSETKVTAGTAVTVSGTGTIADPYVINSTATGGGDSSYIEIAQSGHSFNLSSSPWDNYGFIPVYTNSDGLLQLAQADSIETTATGYITAINGDVLTVKESGYISLPSGTTLSEGQYYWLSTITAGFITDTEPDTSQVILFVEKGADNGVLLNMRVVDQSISVKAVSEGTNADTTLDLSSNNIFRLDLTGFSSAQIDFTGGQNGGNYTLQWYNNSGTMSFDTSFNCVTNLSYGQMDDITAQAGSISFYSSDTAFYSTHTLPDCDIKTDAGIVFETQYQAVLDSATNWGFTLPDAATQVAQNAFLKALKDNLLWTELDVVYVFAVDSEDFSKINWKAVDTLTVNGSMTFTADAGWAGDGIGGYLATGKNVSAGGYAQGDASFIVDINTASSSDIFDLGTSTNGLIFGSNSSGSNYYFRLNSNSDNSFAHSGADTGFFHMNVLSGTYNLYRNGTDLGLTFTQLNNTTPSGTLDLGRRTSSYSDAQFSFCAWGVSLTGVQAGNLYTAWNTYKSSL